MIPVTNEFTVKGSKLLNLQLQRKEIKEWLIQFNNKPAKEEYENIIKFTKAMLKLRNLMCDEP